MSIDSNREIEYLRKHLEQTRFLLLQVYLAEHKEAWQEGVTIKEAQESIFHYLADNALDPNRKQDQSNVKWLLSKFRKT